MKAHLLFKDRDFSLDDPEPDNAEDLADDLELATLVRAMADGDELISAAARCVLLHPLTDPDQVVYRQQVLDDCLRQPAAIRDLYELAGDAMAAEHSVFRGFLNERPESMLDHSVQILELFVDALRKLRRFSGQEVSGFRSDGFTRFFSSVREQLGDDYFDEIEAHLKLLKFHNGLLLSARLGAGSQSTDFVLRQPRQENRSLFNRVGLKKPTFSYTVPDRDEAGLTALATLRDQGLADIANAAAQSVDHVLSFFTAIRSELAFYLGCVNLRDALARKQAPVCLPVVTPVGTNNLNASGLYDICLQLQIETAVVSNSVDADGSKLLMITGANQGGKSTFLRSIGLAQLMAAAGMFAPARAFAASGRTAIATHFKREEDHSMTSGKFDEELARMSRLADTVARGALLLCNESFQSTNEREGSEIGKQVIDAMTEAGVTVVFVTHLYDLARGFYERRDSMPATFLRADRGPDGARSFRLVPAEPIATSFGKDVYDRVFAQVAQKGHATDPTGVANESREDPSR